MYIIHERVISLIIKIYTLQESLSRMFGGETGVRTEWSGGQILTRVAAPTHNSPGMILGEYLIRRETSLRPEFWDWDWNLGLT